MAYSDYGYSRAHNSYGNRVHRSASMEAYHVRVYCGQFNNLSEFLIIDALRNTQSDEIVKQVVQKLRLGRISNFELAEAFCSGGQICKEKRLESNENPVRIQLLWPKVLHYGADTQRTEHKFFLRKKELDKKPGVWEDVKDINSVDNFLSTFLQQPDKEYPDLCNLPDLNETTLLDNIKHRFINGNIYTYIGSILIAVNPFRFYAIYNPKYVQMYQNKKLGELPPHIFAIADSAYHKMLEDKANQCIVISGESGSGKTESTNLLLSHLSALSQKGAFGEGIEQTILGAGPVLEAFGNAKTVHNNNSSRFGKFIQVNYRENGIVHGAVVEKYLLEKSRLVHQAYNERNYHVFYYLLVGCTESEKSKMGLTEPEDYHYLKQSNCFTIEDTDGEIIDEIQDFEKLKQSMELVGFSKDMQSRIFCVLASVLHLGNIEFNKKRHVGHHEAVQIENLETVRFISNLLKVKEATLVDALIKKKTQAGGETVVINYDMKAAVATRDAMAKCLYGALFDWIVLQVNQALISKRDLAEHKGNSIGVLDIFGFEDFGNNSFEQFCINYANEHLQYYFNQHIFKYEQEEYVKEGIQWKNIEFIDNTGCLDLFGKRLTGLLCILDEECNFPGATNETLLSKFISLHKNNEYFEAPQMRENAFSIVHYAGKVKYRIVDFREKNSDLMRHDIMLVLKNSSLAFVRELVGYDPVAMLRWSIVRAFFRSYFAFIDSGRRFRSRDGAPKFGANVRKHSQTNRAQHLAMSGNVSENARSNRKVLIIEKDTVEDSEDDDDDDEDDEDDHDYENVYPGRFERKGSGVQDILNGSHYSAEEYRVMRKASKVLQKNKSFKPKTRAIKQLRDLQRMKTLAGKTQLGPRPSKGKNKPPSVGAQFNYSLSKLIETLSQANPFFIRCIKSNADKSPLCFDDSVVLRQLRYTGMLATVRIRQSGYNYRVTFQDFIQMYRILLPKGLVSSREDLERFLLTLDLNRSNYQIGQTKVFLREAEKMLLDNALHRAIMKHIVNMQRWFKCQLERNKFIKIKSATIVIQSHFRSFLAQKQVQNLKLKLYAAIMIQQCFRKHKSRQLQREVFKRHEAVLLIQKYERMRQAKLRLKLLKHQKNERDIQISLEEQRVVEMQLIDEQLQIDEKTRSDNVFVRKQIHHKAEQSNHILEEGKTVVGEAMVQINREINKESISAAEKVQIVSEKLSIGSSSEDQSDNSFRTCSSPFVETHLRAEENAVLTRNESDTVSNYSTKEVDESYTIDEEVPDKLLESGDLDIAIPGISRDRGYSKESFESEFDLSFSESTFPKLSEVNSQEYQDLPEVKKASSPTYENKDKDVPVEKNKNEEADEWGQLEIEFTLDNNITSEPTSEPGEQRMEVNAGNYDDVFKTNADFKENRSDKYIIHESVLKDKNKTTDQSALMRAGTVDMMAEIDAEIKRRQKKPLETGRLSPKNNKVNLQNSSFVFEDDYVVGKDKISVSEDTNTSKKSLVKDESYLVSYIVGKDKAEIENDSSFSPSPNNKDRSSRYLVQDESEEDTCLYDKANSKLSEYKVPESVSSQDIDNTLSDSLSRSGRQSIDGSPIISKYKQRKKDHTKEKYVRKESKDIYIVERTEIVDDDNDDDDDDDEKDDKLFTKGDIKQSTISTFPQNESVISDNKAKYAEIVKIKKEPTVIITKDNIGNNSSFQHSSQGVSNKDIPQSNVHDVELLHNKSVSKSQPLASKSSSSLPVKLQNKYASNKPSDTLLPLQTSHSASDISAPNQHIALDIKPLTGRDTVEIVVTKRYEQGSGEPNENRTSDGTGRKVVKQTSENSDAKADKRSRHPIEKQTPQTRASIHSSHEHVSPNIVKERRYSDIYQSSDVSTGILPGETSDLFDGSACVKHRRKLSDANKNKPRARSVHSTSTPHLRGQDGPKDIEILIKPAKMMKSVSEDHLLTASATNAKLHNKKVSAPLATQESLEAPIEEDGVYLRKIELDTTKRISFVMPGQDSRPFTITGGSQESLDPEQNVLSPLSKAKKRFKNLVSAPTQSATVKEAWTETKQAANKQKNRRKGTKKRRASKSDREGNTWNVSSTSKLKYPTKVLVKGPTELQQLESFMGSKIREYRTGVGQKPSIFDKVFLSALQGFQNDLITSLSVSLQESRVEYRYNNLMCNFEDSLRSPAMTSGLTEEAGDINMGINAFSAFLDEFQRKKVTKELPEPQKIKKEKKKKDKDKELIEINGHKYSPVQFSIHTVCEKCNSHVWLVEKGYVCQTCHYTVHKKCSKESVIRCKGYVEPKSSHKGKVFNVTLSSLVEPGRKVPLFIEKLIAAIELNGLYTTGIYRKAGGAGKVRQLVKDLNTDVNTVEFMEEPLHALASLIKQFLRDLPEPLLTFDLYDDFIHASEITDEREKTQAIFNLLEKLPQSNYDLFERLVFHLAKIAQHENSNRMNPSALAIVFAPTMLRSNKNLTAQESLCHVPRLSRCMQCIIEEQLRKLRHTLADIQTLDNAAVTAEERLSTIRASLRQKSHKQGPSRVESIGATAAPIEETMPEEEEECTLLQEQIQSLQDEKEILTVQMPTLDYRASSSEDDLLSTDEFGSTGDEIDVISDRAQESVAAYNKSSLESQSKKQPVPNQQHQQKGGYKKHGNKKRRKGSGSNPFNDTESSDSGNKRTLPSLQQIGEEMRV